MFSYEFLPHTADARMRVEADSLPELFAGALAGMAHLLKTEISGYELKVESVKYKIKVTAADATELLVNFLSEALTQSNIQRAAFREAVFATFTDIACEAELSGVRVEAFDEDIKAVTYHGAHMQKNEKGLYEVTILFDI